jgi:hypothetical protein
VAFDVYAASDGSRWRHALAAAATFSILAWFTVLTILVLLFSTGRWRSPGCWLRLPRWALGIAFVTLPDLVSSVMPGHHPSDLADPPGLVACLRDIDLGVVGATVSTSTPGVATSAGADGGQQVEGALPFGGLTDDVGEQLGGSRR